MSWQRDQEWDLARANRTMEAIRATARETAFNLEETLVAETVDFIVYTSLQILSLDHRMHLATSRPGFDAAQRREKIFNVLIRYTAAAFVAGNQTKFEGAQRTLVLALRKTDEALVTRFTRLMETWKADKNGSVGTAIADQAKPGESSKSLCAPTTLQPHMLGSEKRKRGWDTTATVSKPSLRPLEENKMDELTKGFASAFTEPTTSSRSSTCKRPADASFKRKPIRAPDLSGTQQQPCEANAFGVETSDGVLVGHPPEYPPGLLDWESSEDDEEFQELVSNRRARVGAQARTSDRSDRNHRYEVDNSAKNSEDPEQESDNEWVCI